MPRLARTPWTRRLHPTRSPLLGLRGPCLATASHPPALPIRLPRWQRPQNAVRLLPCHRRSTCGPAPAASAPQHAGLGGAPGSRLPWGLATGALETRKRLASCVGRESNPGQLLGRQLCSPLYHQRCTARAAPRRRPRVRPGVCTRLWSPPRRPSAPRPCPDDPPVHSAAQLLAPAEAARRPTRASPTRLGGSPGPPATRPWGALRGPPPPPPRPLCRPGIPVPRDPPPSRHALAPALLHRLLGEATSRAHGGPHPAAAHPSPASRPVPSGPLHPSSAPAPPRPGGVQ